MYMTTNFCSSMYSQCAGESFDVCYNQHVPKFTRHVQDSSKLAVEWLDHLCAKWRKIPKDFIVGYDDLSSFVYLAAVNLRKTTTRVQESTVQYPNHVAGEILVQNAP